MPLRSSSPDVGLELKVARPGEAVLNPSVLDPQRMRRIGMLLYPYFFSNVLNYTSRDELGRRDVEFVKNGEGRVPLPLRGIIEELDETFPDEYQGRISLLRVRRQGYRRFSRHLHSDGTFDYRRIAAFIGEGDLASKDPQTGLINPLLSMLPGGVIDLNNVVSTPEEKLPHGSRLQTPHQLILVYGREATRN